MEKEQLAMTIGENIGNYRQAAGLTQAQLAERVGVGTAFISRVERGQKMMKVQTLYTMAEALGVSCDALFYPANADTALRNIHRLLADCPAEYVTAIEQVIRVCMENFSVKEQKPSQL